jgi:hypothetical protein
MRINVRSVFLSLFFAFFVLAMAGGLLWANLVFVKHAPSGVDFTILWKSTRNFMMQDVTPYGTLTTLNIQTLVYGRPARLDENPLRVNVPFFDILLFMPFGAIGDIALARASWLVVLELGLAGVMFLSLHVSRWKPSILYLVLLWLFGIFWAPTISALSSGSSIILQTLLLVGVFRVLDLDGDELAGAFLLFAASNIEATGAVILLVLLWSAWAGRWRVWGGFWMSAGVLFILALVFLPAWPLDFIRIVFFNWRSAFLPTTFSLFENWFPGVGLRLARGLAALTLVVLFLEWRAVLNKDVRWLFWTASLTAAMTPLLGFPFTFSWLVFSFPAFMLVLSVMEQRWGLLGRLTAIAVLLLALAGLWAVLLNGMAAGYILAFPIALAIFLYWVRWWAIRPPRLWADAVMGRV